MIVSCATMISSNAERSATFLDERVPQDHPLRSIRKSVDEILRSMAKELDGTYAKSGRPSVPPERLLRAVLLQIFLYRTERTNADGADEL